MANEITITTGLALTNGLLIVPASNTTTRFDQTTARGGGPGVLDIGTSEETITFGDCVPGYIEMVNLDASNFVTWGNVTANLDQKLSANGGRALFEMVSGGVLIMEADTATCKVKITCLNI